MTKPTVPVAFEEQKLPADPRFFDRQDPIPPASIKWFFKTVSVAPSAPPNGWWDQIQIVYGVNVFLYFWDTQHTIWRSLQF